MAVKQNQTSTTSKIEDVIPKRKSLTQEQLNEKIAKKAYELYVNRGRISGFAEKDWLQAQKIVLAELKAK
jgi:hypothetical protein